MREDTFWVPVRLRGRRVTDNSELAEGNAASSDQVVRLGNLGLRDVVSHVDENGHRVITGAKLVYVSIPAEAIAVTEALASVRAEGLEPTSRGLELLEGMATGVVSEDAAIEELVRHHQGSR
jgi:hypothetical protein